MLSAKAEATKSLVSGFCYGKRSVRILADNKKCRKKFALKTCKAQSEKNEPNESAEKRDAGIGKESENPERQNYGGDWFPDPNKQKPSFFGEIISGAFLVAVIAVYGIAAHQSRGSKTALGNPVQTLVANAAEVKKVEERKVEPISEEAEIQNIILKSPTVLEEEVKVSVLETNPEDQRTEELIPKTNNEDPLEIQETLSSFSQQNPVENVPLEKNGPEDEKIEKSQSQEKPKPTESKENEGSLNFEELVSAMGEEGKQIQSLVNSLEESNRVEEEIPPISPPAPISALKALSGRIGRILVAPSVDPSHLHTFQALQTLKVVEADVSPVSICTRRQYARWLVTATNHLARDQALRIFPAMFVEGLTDLAFQDVPPEDPDFGAIQGLAECGLIASQLSQSDLKCRVKAVPGCMGTEGVVRFSPDSPLTRQDMLSWRVALEHRVMPPAPQEEVQRQLAYLDVEEIHPVARSAISLDLSQGPESIVATAFGFTRRFEPLKPVTAVQAGISLGWGELGEVLSEEVSRHEAERIAEVAVQAVAEEEAEVAAAERRKLEEERAALRGERAEAEKILREAEERRGQGEGERRALWEEISRAREAVEEERRALREMREEREASLQEIQKLLRGVNPSASGGSQGAGIRQEEVKIQAENPVVGGGLKGAETRVEDGTVTKSNLGIQEIRKRIPQFDPSQLKEARDSIFRSLAGFWGLVLGNLKGLKDPSQNFAENLLVVGRLLLGRVALLAQATKDLVEKVKLRVQG